jgi:hypothetical protein
LYGAFDMFGLVAQIMFSTTSRTKKKKEQEIEDLGIKNGFHGKFFFLFFFL